MPLRRAGLLLPCLLAAVAAGCGGAEGAVASHAPFPGDRSTEAGPAPPVQEPGQPAPRTYRVTPDGVHLHHPVWLDHYPDVLAALLEELRAVVPEADPRVSPDARGVPAGVTVIVLDPGPYYAPYSPTLLASGEWRAPSTIYVAWRGTPSGPFLPALPHELRHLLTLDPLAGH